MFTVYAEKDVFENIIIFNNETPNWYKIFCNHADICLNISDEDLALEEIQGTPIFEFIMANGGRSPVALKNYFDSIYEDNSIIADKPRSAFFLKYNKEQTETIQKQYGVVVQSMNDIDDNILTGVFKRKLLKDEIVGQNLNEGWKSMLNYRFPPSNSLLISDNYLMPATERVRDSYVSAGKKNLVWLLDHLLPQDLSVDYHITIISQDDNKNEAWRNKMAGDLNTEIGLLRKYQINVEVIFIKSEHLHERILMMNYINASCEHGFHVFKAKDGKTVHMVNKLQISSYFNSLDNNQGEGEYLIASKDLRLIKKVCNDLGKHIVSRTGVYRGAILGRCNPDKTLRNRLINDI